MNHIYLYCAVACHKIAGYLLDASKDLLEEGNKHREAGSNEEAKRLYSKVSKLNKKITKWQDKFDYFIARV